MVNVGFGLPSVLGIALILAGAGLYFLRTMRPALARDQDIFFAAISLLCGGILFFQGWRLDPILQFAQFLSTGAAAWFAFEAVRLRGVTTEQAKRSTPVVDEDRPVSTRYRAELDDLPPIDERRRVSPSRRIQGSRDTRNDYDDYADDRSRRSSSRDDRYSSDDRSRHRAPRPLPSDRSQSSRDWNDDSDSSSTRSRTTDRGEASSNYGSDYGSSSYSSDSYSSDSYSPGDYGSDGYSSGNYSSGDYSSGENGSGTYSSGTYNSNTYSTSDTNAASRPRRPRSNSDASPRRRGSGRAGSDFSSDYVDYQPIDYPEET